MKGITAEAKDEIAEVQLSDCCNTALLSALIHSAGSISFMSEGVGVYIVSEHEGTVLLAAKLIELLYGHKAVAEKDRLELRGSYVYEMLLDLGILTYDGRQVGAFAGINGFVVAKPCCIKSYLKGLFLGCGSASVTKKYHLEMNFSTKEMADDVCALLADYDISAHYTLRKDRHIVYIKSNEGISDFFALIGANKAVLELNNTAALRYVNMYTNRRINCDLANADKVVEASMRQIEAIKKVRKSLSDEKLSEVADARLNNPDFSYEGLAELLHVSKGCIKYRLNKILALAEEKEEVN